MPTHTEAPKPQGWLSQAFYAVLNIGVRPNQPSTKQNKIRLSNALAIFYACIPFLFLLITGRDPKVITSLVLMASLQLGSVALNYWGAHGAARLLLCFVTLLTTLGFGLIVNAPGAELVDARLFLLAAIAMPLVLFDFDEMHYMLLGITLVLASNFSFEWLVEHLALPRVEVPDKPLLRQAFGAFSFFLLIVAFWFLQWINQASERQRTALLAQVQQQIQELSAREKELRQNSEELEALNEQLEQRNQAYYEQALNLAESQERFRLLAEATTEGLVVIESGIILDANETFGALQRAKVKDLLGTRVVDCFAPEARASAAEALMANHAEPQEAVGERRDGTQYPVEFRVRSLQREGRSLQMIAWRDITEQKEAEHQRLAHNLRIIEQKKLLVELGRHPAVTEGDISAAIQILAQAAATHLHADRVALWYYEPDGQLRLEGLFETQAEAFQENLTLELAHYPRYYQPGLEPSELAVTDLHRLTVSHETDLNYVYLHPVGVRALLNAPILFGGKPLGIFSAEVLDKTRRWSDEDISFQANLAELLATTLEIYQRKRAETALRESERRLRAISDSALYGIVTFNARGEIVSTNPGAQRLFGWADESSYQGLSIRRLLPDLQKTDDEPWPRRLQRFVGETIESRAVHQLGHEFPIDLSIAAWTTEEGEFYTAILNDISDRKQSEEALKAANRQLAQTLEELQRTQSQLIESEKLAALGQIVANVAHEINNPMGAIKSSIQNMGETLPRALDALPALQRALPPEQAELLNQLLGTALRQNPTLSSREERSLMMDLEEYLAEQGLGNADEAAELLVKAGLTKPAEIEPFKALIAGPQAQNVLSLTAAMGSFGFNLQRIHNAVDKAQRTVKALKNYSYKKQDDSAETFDLHENLENVLTLYANHFRHGVTLHKDWQPVPPLLGYPQELSQVWSNLIINGIQAMKLQGDLTVRVQNDGTNAIVEIVDTGGGIPPEKLARIFDQYFTTKPKGEGTGLGLHISQQIVEKHGGTIRVRSQPGETCFQVLLPLPLEAHIANQ